MDKIGTPLSMEEVYINETDLVENVKTDRNLHDKGRRNDFGGTDEAGSVLFEEIKTKGNLIEKRQVVMFEVTDVAGDLSIDDTSSVLELDSNVVKVYEEKEDEVSRLLFALRALCTSDNTDVVLLCGTWQMRPLSKEDRKKIQDLHLRDYVGNFCPQLTEELEILSRIGRKAEIQQVSEEREPGFLAQGFLTTKLLYLERLACEGLGGEIF